MKKLITLTILLASTFIFAENIDGTLAVDSYQAKKLKSQAVEAEDNTLSAGMNDDYYSSKDSESATSLPASAYSFLEGPFVGIELSGMLGVDADGVNSGGISWGLRFGAQNLEWRTMAVLESFSNSDDDNNYLRGAVQLDYFFLGSENLVIENYPVRPYFGLNIGALSMDTQKGAYNIKTLTYGAQIGATMSVTNNIDLDLSYKYNTATADEISSMHGITLGLNYKY